jgi:glycosyltransferase involved in cell wall biosynthesis
MQADTRRSAVILTKYARFYGGVELANYLLMEMLEEEGYATRIISQEILGKGLLLRARKRLFGLNKLLACQFNRYYSTNTDVVICNGEFSLGVCHPAAINVFHGCYYGYGQAMRPFLSERGYKWLMHMAEQQKRGAEGKQVIAVSGSVARILEQQGLCVDAVIDNAVDAEQFRPAPFIRRNNRCLFVGSSDYYGKGIDILEKLANLGVQIDCVTADRPRDTRLGWLGNIPNEKMPEYYQRYYALLLPSRFEGSALVILEAMACGTPVVTTSVGSGSDIAQEIPEFVVDGPWDGVPEKIADRLSTINSHYGDFSARAREYVVRHHSYRDWKRKWLDAIDQLQQRSGRTAK